LSASGGFVAANLVRVEWNFAALTLTGEAMPLEKVPTAQAGTAETPFDLHNICFMGSAVVSGIGCGVA